MTCVIKYLNGSSAGYVGGAERELSMILSIECGAAPGSNEQAVFLDTK